ncbi:hypothetical protein Btru_014991 [Bulinus truncatus]|nr:hypothetical protein Btru_014991 [Bulinus truncatus]
MVYRNCERHLVIVFFLDKQSVSELNDNSKVRPPFYLAPLEKFDCLGGRPPSTPNANASPPHPIPNQHFRNLTDEILWKAFITFTMAEEVVESYKTSLDELVINSKPQISMLTMLAEDHVQYASEIIRVIEEQIKKVQICLLYIC